MTPALGESGYADALWEAWAEKLITTGELRNRMALQMILDLAFLRRLTNVLRA